MKSSAARRLGLLVLVLLFATGCEEEAEPEVLWRPYGGYLPDQDPDVAAVLLVRDARTGQPIEGARVRRCPELVVEAVAGWGPAWEETATDAHGLAWVVLDPRDIAYVVDQETRTRVPRREGTWTAHWVIDAPGYAPTEEYGESVQEEVDLEAGEDLVGRIVDPFGRPAPGVQVELKVGCAHAPALRTVWTDARGHFTLPCVGREGDVCIEGPGVRAAYHDPTDLAPPDGVPTRIQARPGATIRGRIVGPERAWLAKALVQSRTSSRGPMARVSPDGFFRLEGADVSETLLLLHEEGSEEVEARLDPDQYRPGGPLVWFHPAPPSDTPDALVTVRVRRPPASEAATEEGTVVHLDRATDGRRFGVEIQLEEGEEGAAKLQIPAGAYDLSAGHPFAPLVARPRRVDLRPLEHATFEVALEPQPRLQVSGLDTLPADASCALCLADREEPFDPAQHPDLHLPQDAEAVVLVWHLDGARSFRVGPAEGGLRSAAIDWLSPTIVQLPGVHFDTYGTAKGDLSLVHRVLLNGAPLDDYAIENHESGLRLRTYVAGSVPLQVESEHLGTARTRIDLPSPTGARVAVDGRALVPGRPGVLEVEGLEADAEEEGDLHCVVHLGDEHDLVVSEEDGRYRSLLFRDGAHVRIGSHREVLRGPGPYRVRMGTAAIVLNVATEHGGERPVIYLDGRMWRSGWEGDSQEGSEDDPWRVRLHGLDAGAHVLIVGAAGHQPMRADLTLTEGEEAHLCVVLPVRPRPRHAMPGDPQTEDDWWALIEGLDDRDPMVRERARAAFMAAGDRSLPWLIQEVEWATRFSSRHQRAAQVLAALRPEVRDLLAEMLAAPLDEWGEWHAPLGLEDEEVERPPYLALWQTLRVWETRSLEQWVELLRARTFEDPIHASCEGDHARAALSAMGAASLPRLTALLRDPEAKMRYWALVALAENPETGEGELAAIAERLADEASEVRSWAAVTLRSLVTKGRLRAAPGGEPAPDAKPGPVGDALVPLLFEADATKNALHLLRYFPARPSPRLLEGLMALLDEDHREHWRAVAEVLGGLGAHAQPAVALLERVAREARDWGTIEAAETALRRIRGR